MPDFIKPPNANAKIHELGKRFAENEIIINSLADFAIQDETTITLEDGKTYIRGSGLSTSKRFIVGKNVF